MSTALPDFLAPDLHAVFVGTAAGDRSAARGHYYAGPGNEFWLLLYRSGLTPELLGPERDVGVLTYRLGLTDLAKRRSASTDTLLTSSDFDVPGFVRKMKRYQPAWIAFHGRRPRRNISVDPAIAGA